MVGKFSEDMTRLCKEIQTLREDRQDFRKELGKERKAREVAVLKMCSFIADDLARRAKRARGGRMAFLRNLKQSVAEQKKELRADLAMARRVWVGKAV